MNQTDVTAMRAPDTKMVEESANEVSAWMRCSHQIHTLVDVQLSLMGPVLARDMNFQNNICRCAGRKHAIRL